MNHPEYYDPASTQPSQICQHLDSLLPKSGWKLVQRSADLVDANRSSNEQTTHKENRNAVANDQSTETAELKLNHMDMDIDIDRLCR